VEEEKEPAAQAWQVPQETALAVEASVSEHLSSAIHRLTVFLRSGVVHDEGQRYTTTTTTTTTT
jgi:hypothetical protein